MNRISDKTFLHEIAIFCSAILLALLAPATKAEQQFSSEKHHFRIAFPDNWSMIDRKAQGAIVGYGLSKKNSNGTISIVSCSVSVTEAPSTKGKRQEQINSELEKAFNSGVLAKNYADAGLAVTETYTRSIGGVRALVIVGKMVENVYGQDIALARQISLFYTPGVGYSLTCQATAVDFSKESMLFNKVSDSFRFE